MLKIKFCLIYRPTWLGLISTKSRRYPVYKPCEYRIFLNRLISLKTRDLNEIRYSSKSMRSRRCNLSQSWKSWNSLLATYILGIQMRSGGLTVWSRSGLGDDYAPQVVYWSSALLPYHNTFMPHHNAFIPHQRQYNNCPTVLCSLLVGTRLSSNRFRSLV